MPHQIRVEPLTHHTEQTAFLQQSFFEPSAGSSPAAVVSCHTKKVCCALFLLLALPLFSAHLKAQAFEAELIGGGMASQLIGDSFGGFDKLGIMGGVAVSLRTGKKTALKAEICYLQKGSKSRRNEPFFAFHLNYLSLPFLVVFEPSPRWQLQAGPSADMLLSAQTDLGAGKFNSLERYRRSDFCVQMGLRYQFEGLPLSAGLRFSRSLAPIDLAGRLLNQTLHLQLAYHFYAM